METPPLIAWSETFTVGHKGLDAEHQYLIGVINKIDAAERAKQPPTQFEPLFDALRLATENHFRHENSILREISGSAESYQKDRPHFLKAMSDAILDEHFTHHAQELSKLESIIRAFQSRAGSAQSTLSNDLKDWFLEHVIKYDAHLKSVFQAM